MTNLVNPYRFGAQTLIHDTFTDSDSTAIADHTPDIDTVGGGWSGTGLDIQSNTLHIVGTGTKIPLIDAGNANIHLQMAFTSDNIGGEKFGIIFRHQDSDNNWRIWPYATKCDLVQRVGGDENIRATISKTLLNDTEYILNIKGDGDTISFWVDDDTPTVYDGEFSGDFNAETVCGMRAFASGSNIAFVDNFTVVTV